MSVPGPWLLIAVDGPSEVQDVDGEQRSGVVVKLVARAFGDECAAHATVVYWRHVRQSLSPLRKNRMRSLRGFAAKAEYLAQLGQTTAYGTVLLLDNDHDTRQDRLGELCRGVLAAGRAERTAVGVAREMVEAWLLADPSLLKQPLPAGDTCESLWGEKADVQSSYPKHVLRRCVIESESWTMREVIERWRPETARAQAPSLDAFMDQLQTLADQYNRHGS